MFNFFKKKKKKVYDKWFLLVFATVVVCLGIGNELYKGTSAVELPVNEAFDDMSFYMCIIDAYNNQNKTDYEYTYNLSDKELASITYLNCSAIGYGLIDVDKIKSVKGIEKLVSLVDLELFEHDITSIDVSKNVLLEKAYLNDNKLGDINVSGNSNLTILVASGNQLTSIDVSNNIKLEDLILSKNQLTSIDVSNNENLKGLFIDSNKLTELDLTNNNELEFVFSFYNSFSKIINLYKGDTVTLDSITDIIKLPSGMSQDLFSWLVWDIVDANVISMDENNIVTALNGGIVSLIGGVNHDDITNIDEGLSYFLIDYVINVIDISSQDYIINNEENIIYSGNLELDVNKIDVVGFDLQISGDKLQILYEDILITELDILKIDFDGLNVYDNNINIMGEVAYEDFISYITKSDKISYKILNNNNELIDSGNILSDSKLEIYYEDILLDIYNINLYNEDESLIVFDGKIILNEENNFIKYKNYKSTIDEFLSSVIISSDVKIFVSDKDGNEKDKTDLVVTGDILTVFVGSEKKAEYSIVVRGDANGDGNVTLTDLVQLRKHIVGWKNPETGIIEKKTGVYLDAIDMNNDDNISLTDLVRVRKLLVGIDIDE